MSDFKVTRKEVLDFHQRDNVPGKLQMDASKPIDSQRHLALAYSPGVAYVCDEIFNVPSSVYNYTAKGNTVAVVTNGTALLGLGNRGPLAAKPVMEGKAILLKKFAGVNAVDIEIATQDVDEFITVVKNLEPCWGGINLEDIRAPDCFIIEKKLDDMMDIPVFHDDQHGTAIIVCAALINAMDITGRSLKDVQIVVNGAGAAAIACINLMRAIGVKNITVCDQNGVIFKGRKLGMNIWKEQSSVATNKRTLSDALKGADVFIGLSVKDVLNEEMLLYMNNDPIIFAMANPDPEVSPDLVKKLYPNAIVATGRSDYSNQVNNVLCFPYIFRGALDVRARTINEEMKLAAVHAIADLAREPVSEDVFIAYSCKKMSYGPEYIIPTPFDNRLITKVSLAVARAAIDTGVVINKSIGTNLDYINAVQSKISPISNVFSTLENTLRGAKKTIIFAEGEDERAIRAAIQWRDNGNGTPILVAREDKVYKMMDDLEIDDREGVLIKNASNCEHNQMYIDYLYSKLQRKGHLYRSCVRMVKTDRNVFAASMLMCGYGDVLITGLTRDYYTTLSEVAPIVGHDDFLFGLSVIATNTRSIFVADTSINKDPSPEELCKITCKVVEKVRKMGHIPKVAFVASSTFNDICNNKIARTIELLKEQKANFTFDGGLSVDVALNARLLGLYPFTNLQQSTANVLIMPNLESASISTKLLSELSNNKVVGPLLIGMKKSVQIMEMTSGISDVFNLSLLFAARF